MGVLWGLASKTPLSRDSATLVLLLIFYIKIREKYLKDYTVEQLSMILRKVKCKVYESRIIPQERDKKQREIFEQANILVPKFWGI